MIRAVLFDLDGVLIDSQEAWYQAMVAAAEVFDCPPLTREQFAPAFGQSIADDVRDFYPGRTVEEVEGWLVDNFRRFAHHVSHEPTAVAVFAALAAHDIRRAVVTNTPGELATALLAAGGIVADLVVGTDAVVNPKPDAEGVHKALATFSLTPSQALLVGDSDFDRKAAAAAGVRFVGYRIDGDARIESLGEILPSCGIEP